MWIECLECHAIVGDEVAHALWHATLNTTTRRVS